MFSAGQPRRTFGRSSSLRPNSTLLSDDGSDSLAISAEEAKYGRIRQHERINVTIPALLHVHGRFQQVKIRDISAGGACLDGVFGVMAADKVVVELLDRRTLSARARWWIAGRCGIAFDTVLELTDDLLELPTISVAA